MDESKSVVSSGAYGIPKWIMKKGMRYEVDDFIVSPPSLDDGGFLRLRYGRTGAPDPSLQDASKDGGMTVEVKDDTLQFSSDPSVPTATISIGPGGFSLESSTNGTTTPITTPETKTESPAVHPLLVLPMNFGGAAAVSEELSPTKNVESAANHNATTLLEKVQSLSVATASTQSLVSSPSSTPFTTPKNSPTFGRKRLGITMDPPRKISAHSYFCTKRESQGLFDNSKYKQELMMNPQQIEAASIPEHALDPKMMGQRRKRQPKPSTLREMNFWAPTSM